MTKDRVVARTSTGLRRRSFTPMMPSPPQWFSSWAKDGLSTGAAPAFYDSEGPPVEKILSYSPKKTWTFMGLFMDRELTGVLASIP